MGDRPAMTRRLLYVVNDAGYFASHRLALGLAARAAGWEVHVATAPGPGQDRIRAAGLHAHSVPITRAGVRPDREIAAVIALARLYRQVRPDLVHLVALKAIVLGGLAARLAPVPALVAAFAGFGHVASAPGWRGLILRGVLRTILPLAVPRRARVIAQNPDDRDKIAGVLGGRRDIALIRGVGIDLARFRPAPEPAGPVTVVLASRMLKSKGVGEFAAAARQLKAAGSAARFILAGEPDAGNPATLTRAQLAAWADDGAVEWIGFCDDVPALLARSHIVCLPSYGEGLPLGLLEAAAAGKPIVSTDVSGCREVVRQGDNGILVPARDARALAAALERLIGDATLRARFGERSREIAEQEFDERRAIAATLAIYGQSET
jgi:glycosyltransferase involved in cell wall biosynthesis